MSVTDLVLLDLDGCLVDSTVAITGSLRHALTCLGVPAPSSQELRWCIGPPLLESIGQLLREADADPSRAAEGAAHYEEHYRTASLELTRVVPDVPAALDVLGASATLAVVTSKPAPAAVPLIAHLGLMERFVEVHAPASNGHREPKAVTLARALASLAPGGDHARAVMVGDRSHDVVAGLACGIRTVGVTWGAGDHAELSAAGAHAIVRSPQDLAAAVFVGTYAADA